MAEEGQTRPIPIRRSRPGGRVARTGFPVPAVLGRWSDGLLVGAQTLLAPPRQLWLAGLGGSRLGFSGARAAWEMLVAEGADAERWLLDRLDEWVDSAREAVARR
jgi:hypothetical protein